MIRICIALLLFSAVAVSFILFFNRADEHGRIRDLESEHFSLWPVKINPEVDYEIPPVIHFNNQTEVTGEAEDISDLRNGKEVKLWIKEIKGMKRAYKIKLLNKQDHSNGE